MIVWVLMVLISLIDIQGDIIFQDDQRWYFEVQVRNYLSLQLFNGFVLFIVIYSGMLVCVKIGVCDNIGYYVGLK